MLVFQTNAPGSESSGWSGSFEQGRCGNGNLPPSDTEYFYAVYYVMHNCRHPSWHFESAQNEVVAGTYTFKLSATSGGDGWAVNGYDFYAQLNRPDDVYTHVAGSHTDIRYLVTVGNPANQYAGAAISVEVTQSPIAPPPSASGPPVYIPVAWSASWSAASAFCSARGGSLAAVTSADETQLLLQALTTAGFDRVWLGGNDRNLEGTWVWVGDGRSFPPTSNPDISYANWRSNEPNNNGNQDCMRISVTGSSAGEWLDTECGNRYYFACQGLPAMPPSPPPPPPLSPFSVPASYLTAPEVTLRNPNCYLECDAGGSAVGATLSSFNALQVFEMREAPSPAPAGSFTLRSLAHDRYISVVLDGGSHQVRCSATSASDSGTWFQLESVEGGQVSVYNPTNSKYLACSWSQAMETRNAASGSWEFWRVVAFHPPRSPPAPPPDPSPPPPPMPLMPPPRPTVDLWREQCCTTTGRRAQEALVQAEVSPWGSFNDAMQQNLDAYHEASSAPEAIRASGG